MNRPTRSLFIIDQHEPDFAQYAEQGQTFETSHQIAKKTLGWFVLPFLATLALIFGRSKA